MGQWSNLPADLLNDIEKHLSYLDFIRFCAVCVNWKAVQSNRPKLRVCQIPWLLLPSNEDNDAHCNLYSLLDEKVCSLELPETRRKLYRGSYNGWLVTVQDGLTLNLLNPFTRVQIDLPPISTFPVVKDYQLERRGEEDAIFQLGKNPCIFYHDREHVHDYFIVKIALSSGALSIRKNFVAMAIYGEFDHLAFCKCGDERWKTTSTLRLIADVIFHKRKFYAVTCSGRLICCDPDHLPEVQEITVELPKLTPSCKLYLVGTTRGLIMVERCCQTKGAVAGRYQTIGFNIYKLDTRQGKKRWSELKSLGNNMLFLGYNSSFSVLSQNFPALKGNCIYYADDLLELHIRDVIGGFDVGIFCMEDGSINTLPGCTVTRNTKLVWPPPIWVVPSSC